MSEALSIHHDQAGHQFETNVDGHRAYLTYMDLVSKPWISTAPSCPMRCVDAVLPRR